MSLSTPNSLRRMTKRRGVTRSQIRKLPSVYPDVQTFKFQVRRPQLCDRIVGHGAPLKATFALSPRSPEAAKNGGEGGIRTPDTVARMPHFECGAFNHSATSPSY